MQIKCIKNCFYNKYNTMYEDGNTYTIDENTYADFVKTGFVQYFNVSEQPKKKTVKVVVAEKTPAVETQKDAQDIKEPVKDKVTE